MALRQIQSSQLASIRQQLIKRQGNVCGVCGKPFTRSDDAVVDHDHDTGCIRGAIHRSCNMAEGKVKVKANRSHRGVKSNEFIIGLGKYLEHHLIPRCPFIHPEHMTPEKKRLERNKKAKIQRMKKKLLSK